MLGEHCIKTWSTTQGSLALSVCEAEYYAVVDGATRALGMQTAAEELGISSGDIVIEVATDSSGAKSFASRRGTGRIRHIEVRWLWLQQAVAEGRFRMRKVLGAKNPADVCTKYLTLSEAKEKLRAVNVEVLSRRREDGSSDQMESWLKTNIDGSRIKWADAVDSDVDDEAAVGACWFCGSLAEDGRCPSSEGGC